MSRSKKFFIILAVIFMVTGLVMIGVSLKAAEFDFSNLSTVSYETNTYEIKENFEALIVNDIDGDIRIMASESGVCKVIVRDTGSISHKVEAYDGTLHITSEDNREWYEYIGIYAVEDCEVVIELPEEEYTSALIKTISGDIAVSDKISFEDAILISTSGDILFNGMVKNEFTVKSTSGEIQLTDISVKELMVSGTSSDIEMERVNVENKAKIEAVSGDVELDSFDAGVIVIKTTSGDVEADLVTAKNFDIDTTSGDVSIPVSDLSAGDCVVKTVSGDVKIELHGKNAGQ